MGSRASADPIRTRGQSRSSGTALGAPDPRDRRVANVIARREAAGGQRAIVRTAAAGRSRLGELGSEQRPSGAEIRTIAFRKSDCAAGDARPRAPASPHESGGAGVDASSHAKPQAARIWSVFSASKQ
jgi:hypothetical protein